MKIYLKPITPLLAAAAVLACLPPPSAANPVGGIVYDFNPENFRPAPENPWKAEKVTRTGGATALRIAATGAGWNNYLFVPPGKLQGGKRYRATVRYEIVESTRFPDSFYMFARSKKLGQARDLWQMWNGDPGEKGVATLVMSLGDADDWVFYVGCKGPGTIVLDSCRIVEGTGYEFVPAAAEAVSPVSSGKLPTGSGPVVVDPPANTRGPQLSTADFGLVADGPNEPVTDEIALANMDAVKRAIAACREQKASLLRIPKGVYRFASHEAMPLVDLKDLTIDGQGSEFVFQKLHPGVEAISVSRCERVVIRNLFLDWNGDVTPIASLGRVLSATPDGKSYDFAFDDLTEKQAEATRTAPWTHAMPMDPATLTRYTPYRHALAVASVEKVDARTLRAAFKEPTPLEVGKTYCIRHLYYGMDAFKVGFSSHLSFENVTIYSMPGMGWFNTGDMHHWQFVNCRVARRPGSRLPLTTAADGFHISQSQGNLLLKNCEFTGSGDDSINIHDNVFQGVRRIDDRTLALVNCPPWRLRLNAGDRIELFKGDYTPLSFVSAVTKVEYKNNDTVLTLSEVLPDPLSPLSIARNLRYDTHNVRIENCRFHDTNGRAILLSARDATVENCLFENAIGTAIQFHTEIVGNLWAEGSGASNVVVRGNLFERTSREGRYENAVVYSGAKLPTGVTRYPLFRDLLIEGNRFIDCSGPAVSLISAKNVAVRDNRIESREPPVKALWLSGAIFASHSSDLTLGANRWQATGTGLKAGVVFDPATTAGMEMRGNTVVP